MVTLRKLTRLVEDLAFERERRLLFRKVPVGKEHVISVGLNKEVSVVVADKSGVLLPQKVDIREDGSRTIGWPHYGEELVFQTGFGGPDEHRIAKNMMCG